VTTNFLQSTSACYCYSAALLLPLSISLHFSGTNNGDADSSLPSATHEQLTSCDQPLLLLLQRRTAAAALHVLELVGCLLLHKVEQPRSHLISIPPATAAPAGAAAGAMVAIAINCRAEPLSAACQQLHLSVV
jgi:hypothetical protein